MNNRTTDMPMTSSFFRRYLLGESFRNILIRLTVIASAIILVWCGIMLALIVHMKCQRTKQMQKTSNNQQLYGNRTSLDKTQSNRSECQAHYQSPASPPPQRCCSIVRFLLQLKRCCIFLAIGRAHQSHHDRATLVVDGARPTNEIWAKQASMSSRVECSSPSKQ